MYNGRLSKSFWKGPAEGRCYNSIVRIAFIIMLVIPVFVSCSDNRNQKQDQKSEQPMLSTPTPVYEKPLYIPPTASVPSGHTGSVPLCHPPVSLKRMPFLAQDAVFKRLSEIAEVGSMTKDERREYDESLRISWIGRNLPKKS